MGKERALIPRLKYLDMSQVIRAVSSGSRRFAIKDEPHGGFAIWDQYKCRLITECRVELEGLYFTSGEIATTEEEAWNLVCKILCDAERPRYSACYENH